MSKAEFVEKFAGIAGVTKAEAGRMVDAFTDAVVATLRNGGSVSLPGFGGFTVSDRAERTGRNPRTGESIQIAASRVPKFKAGKGLKDAVN